MIYRTEPETNNDGGRPGHRSTEALWDGLLSLGKRMIAIAVDDAHHFTVWGHKYRNPSQGRIHVQAESAAEADIPHGSRSR